MGGRVTIGSKIEAGGSLPNSTCMYCTTVIIKETQWISNLDKYQQDVKAGPHLMGRAILYAVSIDLIPFIVIIQKPKSHKYCPVGY
jgi:hypothetical protein